MAKRSGRPTIIDIAKQAGVSFKTVSRVLNNNPHVAEELRDRVMKAAAELDYRPNLAARSLAGPRSYSLALLVALHLSDIQSEEDWYLPAFLSDMQFAMTLACQNAGYRLTIEICDWPDETKPPQLPTGLGRSAIDGIIVTPPLCDREEMIRALDGMGIPYVLIAPGLHVDDALSVATDEYGGAAAMTRHLLNLGHRRIAFIKGPDNHYAAAARLQAYRDVMTAFDPALNQIVESGNFFFGSGQQAAEKLLAMDVPPTAIFCANDDMAAGTIAAATQRGIKVPEQLSVAGFDDSAMARIIYPPLTTVRQPLGAMGAAAVKLLTAIEGNEQGHAERQITLPYKLVERASTRALDR